ncbi:acetaldehyde dehydrogenase (acetylating) [Alkaliphilus oremlandii]|uniref:Acetaldehyde dehydrogenase (Acetylating) n=1 Tax=Alkaliphilus oremlandii (strain OhILAs) TaxID=350688 RepID=A8MEM3_ALKOO|nr:acetaldehyde dehydrogenase (acetylating) [Alkaliphilus oremlandii]ABW18352.1 acetaldehyde dehydrogenase (acetylating) [Alkaliphilus oremlandii OhILAs]
MGLIDKDLVSIQETRDLLKKAKEAQKEIAKLSQEQIDTICKAIAKATFDNRVKLAKMAQEETGFGRWQDKVLKNAFASRDVLNAIKDMKTIGIIKNNPAAKYMEVAVPVGVIAGLIPSTNPTSTVIYKSLISIKAGNAIVFSPHPSALNCIKETVRIINEAGRSVGLPEGAISVITRVTMQATNELMKNENTDLILATGGSAMVRAAYSSGTPAIGVGPGNGPAFIERSADIPRAVELIIESKTFDNGTVCASEQSIIVEDISKEKVIAEFKKQGGYFLSKEDALKLEKYILRPNGTMNPNIVGRTAQVVAELAGISVPKDAKVLIAEETRVGNLAPYSREKLSPILAFYTVNTWQEARDLSIQILNFEGAGHTMVLHTTNDKIAEEFGLKVPVSRFLINCSATLGGIGATTNLMPALTLGCGAIGGSSTSDNVGPQNLFNLRRVVYGVRTLEEIRGEDVFAEGNAIDLEGSGFNKEQLVDLLVERVLQRLK